jgi:anti-sigma regulatory factor (Ser/Thr protein kinase)
MPMPAYKHAFELRNDLSELKALCRNLENFGQTSGLSGGCIQAINVGLDELFTNIVSYGFNDNSEHRIRFTINMDEDLLIIHVEDDGIPFNPLEAKEPKIPSDLINVKIGGLGIHFIKKLMDDIYYDRSRSKNKLTLKKSIETNELSHS